MFHFNPRSQDTRNSDWRISGRRPRHSDVGKIKDRTSRENADYRQWNATNRGPMSLVKYPPREGVNRALEVERRKARRIPILATFAISLVIPIKGMHRHDIFDVSEHGIGIISNIEEEFSSDHTTQIGDLLEIHLYLNLSLFLPLSIRVVRIDDAQTGERRIGAEFKNRTSESFKGFLAFLTLLDKIQPVVILGTVSRA
jgi:hypothetical protein